MPWQISPVHSVMQVFWKVYQGFVKAGQSCGSRRKMHEHLPCKEICKCRNLQYAFSLKSNGVGKILTVARHSQSLRMVPAPSTQNTIVRQVTFELSQHIPGRLQWPLFQFPQCFCEQTATSAWKFLVPNAMGKPLSAGSRPPPLQCYPGLRFKISLFLQI